MEWEDNIGVCSGMCSISEESVLSLRPGEICHCQRIKPSGARIPPEWMGLAQRNYLVFTEHLHLISFLPVSVNGQIKQWKCFKA